MNPIFKKTFVPIVLLMCVAGILFLLRDSFSSRSSDSLEPFVFEENAVTAGTILGKGYTTFTHPERGFSLEFPKDLEVNAFAEADGGETIIFQRTTDASLPVEEKRGFQIFITPFEADGMSVITPQRIERDVPGTVVEEPVVVVLGDGTEALVFWGEAAGIGRTRELWIIDDGYLYEITTLPHLDAWLAELMTTWQSN